MLAIQLVIQVTSHVYCSQINCIVGISANLDSFSKWITSTDSCKDEVAIELPLNQSCIRQLSKFSMN